MLVLSRKDGQSIRIGDQIEITIVRVKGQQVRIGIDAPRDERVLRGELCCDHSDNSHPKRPLGD